MCLVMSTTQEVVHFKEPTYRLREQFRVAYTVERPEAACLESLEPKRSGYVCVRTLDQNEKRFTHD